ncbi:ArsR family transcriptional regulator [Leptothoe sp. ISB3NOV94-8A]
MTVPRNPIAFYTGYTEIIEITRLGQANVSKHLKMLTQAGVVSRYIEQQSQQFEALGAMGQAR